MHLPGDDVKEVLLKRHFIPIFDSHLRCSSLSLHYSKQTTLVSSLPIRVVIKPDT